MVAGSRRHHDEVVPVHGRAVLPASLGALGVVFGDLGTSPLYALQEAFTGAHGIAPRARTCSA
jgi:K+ transporter